MRLVCCLVLLLGGLQLTCALRVAAWNIQMFGETKANLKKPADPIKAGILNYIATVVRRYDVVVIQEVHDPDSSKLRVINALMTEVNNQGQAAYDHIQSEPLGTGNYKERYLYVYNTGTVTHTTGESHQYPNPDDAFNRPPFAAKFTAPPVAGQPSYDFVMIPLHATPHSDKTVAEINALHAVVQDLPPAWKTQNILLLGDFNADDTYLKGGEKHSELTLTTENGYEWLIHNGVRTYMFRGQQWTYDRIVATTAMLTHVAQHEVADVKVYNAEPYDFVKAGNLPIGAKQKAQRISDHYPVWVELQ